MKISSAPCFYFTGERCISVFPYALGCSGVPPPPPSISKYNGMSFSGFIQNKERELDKEKDSEESRNLGRHWDALRLVGDIHVRNGEQFNISGVDSVKPNSSIVLEGDTTILRVIRSSRGDNDRHFNSLTVESGSPMLGFSLSQNSVLIIDDLIIKNDSVLRMELFNPEYGQVFLVKKTSRHLQDSLGRIRSYFSETVRYGVRESNMYKDYWEIGTGEGFHALPEPATYGAIFSTGALGFVFWRRKRKLAVG